MNELITACLDAKNVAPLIDFPSFLRSEFEGEVCDWILDYNKRYREPPSISRVQAQFPFFLPIRDDPPLPLPDIIELTLRRKRTEYAQVKLADISIEIQDTHDIPMDKLNELVRVLSVSSGELTRYSTFDRSLYFRKSHLRIGFPVIDRAIGGLANGDYALIAGRLGTGKSTLAQWIAHNWWESGHRILYVSKEMLPMDVFSRIDGIVGVFNPLKLRLADHHDLDPILGVVSSIARHGKGEIFVPSRQVSTPSQVSALAAHLEVDAIIIDGVYLMMTDKYTAARWERVADVSNQIKQMAMTLAVPVVGLTQIRRTGDRDEYTAEDLAYSDALGQDADFILTIHPSDAVRNRVELQLIKNRFGGLAGTVAYFDFDTMRVIDETVSGRVARATEDKDGSDEETD